MRYRETSVAGRIYQWMTNHPDTWVRPSDVGEELGMDRTEIANYLARMYRHGDLERREGEIRKGQTGPRTEYRYVEPVVCPECRDGKHQNCGPALHPETDQIVDCGCSHA